jgi:hypothetical protein
MSCLDLETEVGKMATAMMTRNPQIGKDLIGHLRTQLTVEAVASLMLVSIERVIWFDTDSVFWTIEHLIPTDVMDEIKKIFLLHFYKRLISKGCIPGTDFSVDANGKLLLNAQAKIAILSRY